MTSEQSTNSSDSHLFRQGIDVLPKSVTKTFSELIDQGVLEIGDGYRAKNDELGGGGLIFLRAGHVKDTHIDFEGVERFRTVDDSKFKGKISCVGDVIVTTKGNSTGRIAFVTKGMEEFVYSPHLSFWRSRDESVLCQGFLRAWSRGAEFELQLQSMSRSTDMAPYLSLTDQKRLKITLPTIEEQQSVSELVDALENRITLLRETNTTLECITHALFKSWFVDFDPVRVKAEGLKPKGMEASIAALFPDSLEELGLPKGWAEVSLGKLCSFQKGCSYKGDGLSGDKGAYMFNLGCFNAPRSFAFEKIKRYTGDYKDKHSVSGGDLIVANTDMTQHRAILGRPLFIPDGMIPGFVSHHVFKAVIGNEYGDGIKYFLFFCFLQSSFRERAVGYATGTTVLALPREALEKHLITFPGHQLIKAFADYCEPVFSSIQINEVQAQNLTRVRDTLLPRLLSGKVRLEQDTGSTEKTLSEAI